MAIQDTIKGYFETGDIPTQAQFYQWIDELMFTDDLGTHFNTGLMTIGIDGSFTPSAGTVMGGDTVFQALQKLQYQITNVDISGKVSKAGDTMSGSLLFLTSFGIDTTTTGGSDILNIGTGNADVINIGRSGITVNIQGTTFYQNVTELQVTDKLFTVNKGGSAASATGTGFEIEENSLITGYFKTNAGRTGFSMKAPATTGAATFLTPTTDQIYTLPNASGTILLNPIFSDGSIIYWNAGFAESNATFFFDPTNTILYVGTNSNPLSLSNLKAYFQGNINSYSQINSINIHSGTTASGDIVISADNATDSARYVNLGINSSGNTSTGVLGGALNAYLQAVDGDLSIGTSSAKDLKLFTGGTAVGNERVRFTAFGWTGFNQTQKLSQVSITQVANFVATGTTTVSSSSTITGIGTFFLSQVAKGDLISVSSAPSTFVTVSSISSDNSLVVSGTLGNGTSQTINIRKSPFSILDPSSNIYFILGGSGAIGIGTLATLSNQVTIASPSGINQTLSLTSAANALLISATSGTGITINSSAGLSISATGSGGIISSSSSNSEVSGLTIRKLHNSNSNDRSLELSKQVSSSSGIIGISSYTYISMSDSAGVAVVDFGKFGIISTAVTSGAVAGDFTWDLMVANVMTERMRLTSVGNLGIGTSTFGNSMTLGIAVKSGIAPSSNITDVAQIYVNDIVAGNAAFHFKSENGETIKIYQQANTVAIDTLLINTGFRASGATSIFDLPVAIKAGASSGNIAKVPGVIFTDTTTIGNVGTGEDILFTYSVPAATLNTNKDTIYTTCSGFFGVSANTKQLRVKFGATTIFDSGALPLTLLSNWVLRIEIIRTGASTQKCNIILSFASAVMTNYSTSTETLSGAVNLVITGEGTSDNDIVAETFKVRWEPSE